MFLFLFSLITCFITSNNNGLPNPPAHPLTKTRNNAKHHSQSYTQELLLLRLLVSPNHSLSASVRGQAETYMTPTWPIFENCYKVCETQWPALMPKSQTPSTRWPNLWSSCYSFNTYITWKELTTHLCFHSQKIATKPNLEFSKLSFFCRDHYAEV